MKLYLQRGQRRKWRVNFKLLVMVHKCSNKKDHILLMSTYDFYAIVVILGK